MRFSMIKDEDIQALVDGELSLERARMIRHEIDEDEGLKKRYQDLMDQKDLLKSWWKNLQYSSGLH